MNLVYYTSNFKKTTYIVNSSIFWADIYTAKIAYIHIVSLSRYRKDCICMYSYAKKNYFS